MFKQQILDQTISLSYCRNKGRDFKNLCLYLIKIPVHHIVVELHAVNGAELGDDRQNICLLLG